MLNNIILGLFNSNLITVLSRFAYWDRNRISANGLIGIEHAKINGLKNLNC